MAKKLPVAISHGDRAFLGLSRFKLNAFSGSEQGPIMTTHSRSNLGATKRCRASNAGVSNSIR
jgi:hypothetical protein